VYVCVRERERERTALRSVLYLPTDIYSLFVNKHSSS